MLNSLIQILIVIIVVGGLLYILSVLPIDQTIKTIGRVVILIIAAIYALKLLVPLASAQPAAPDILDRILRRTDNSALVCNIYRNVDRDGDIRYLRMDCRADRRWERGR